MKKLLLLCSILIMPLFAEKYECAINGRDYRIVFKGTRDIAYRVSDKRYKNREYCNEDLDRYLNGNRKSQEYECYSEGRDYRIVFKGTRDIAYRVSDKRYKNREYCNEDLNRYLNGNKKSQEYECYNEGRDYRIVFKGTRDIAYRVSDKRYKNREYCNEDLNRYLNGNKKSQEYECYNEGRDYRIVFKGTRDIAYRVSDKRYKNREYCNEALEDYLSRRR